MLLGFEQPVTAGPFAQIFADPAIVKFLPDSKSLSFAFLLIFSFTLNFALHVVKIMLFQTQSSILLNIRETLVDNFLNLLTVGRYQVKI